MIEEGKEDLKTRCMIIKGEKSDEERKVKDKAAEEEQGGEADDERSEVTTEARTEKSSFTETISSTSTQDYDREVIKKEFINLSSY